MISQLGEWWPFFNQISGRHNLDHEVILYGCHYIHFIFKIYGTDRDLAYVYNKDGYSHLFKVNLKNYKLTEPGYYDGDTGEHSWTHMDEYFNRNGLQLLPYVPFKALHEDLETICLLEKDEETIRYKWDMLGNSSALDYDTKIEGMHFSHLFKVNFKN